MNTDHPSPRPEKKGAKMVCQVRGGGKREDAALAEFWPRRVWGAGSIPWSAKKAADHRDWGSGWAVRGETGSKGSAHPEALQPGKPTAQGPSTEAAHLTVSVSLRNL